MSVLDEVDRDSLARACEAVPLFPLPGVVLLPNTVLPLHVFEQRYRDLVTDALDRALPLIAVPMLADGWERDYEGRPAVHPVTCVGRIVHHERLSDGRFNVALLGLARVRIARELPPEHLYRVAEAALLDDQLPEGGRAGINGHLQQLRMLLAQLIMLHPRLQPELGRFVEHPSPSPVLIDALAHLVFQEPGERQRYIEQDQLTARADLVLEGLAGVIARSAPDVPEA